MPTGQTGQTQRSASDDASRFFAELGASTEALVSNLLANVGQLVEEVTEDSRAVAREFRALYDSARGAARDAARATPRFARIVRDLLRVAASYRVHRTLREGAAAEVLGPEVLQAMLDRLHRESAERLYELCIDLRGGVLKLGQFVSTRRDLLPVAYVEALSRLQDRVPPVPAPEIMERIEADLGDFVETLFASFDRDCLAAASLAQVHAATLADGSRVAVKVQVPGIEEIVATDIAALQVVVPLIGDLVPMADLGTVTNELVRALRAELDYRGEAESAGAFGECFAGDAEVVIPRVHSEYCGAHVVTLELIEGQRLTDFLDRSEERGEEGERDRDRVLEILVRSFCEQILVHGLFHADPHPGNFLVVAGAHGPRLAILDFGNVQRYSAEQRRAYAELGLTILAGNHQRMGELLAIMGFRSRSGDPAALNEFAEMLLETFREGATFDIDPSARLARILELTRDNPIVEIPADFVQLGRVFASLGGLLMRYRPNLELHRILMPCLLRAMQA